MNVKRKRTAKTAAKREKGFLELMEIAFLEPGSLRVRSKLIKTGADEKKFNEFLKTAQQQNEHISFGYFL
jgi:hypothetical protein